MLIYYCAVQLRLPRLRLSGVTKTPALRYVEIDGTNVPVTVTRHRLARRYVVRVAEDGGLRLTVPRGASLAGGFAFAERQADWITREMERQRLRRVPWVTGTRAWFRGEHMALRVSGSSATMLRFVATYIMPLTTIGVYSVPPDMPADAFLPSL